jgi:hypothetical protein
MFYIAAYFNAQLKTHQIVQMTYLCKILILKAQKGLYKPLHGNQYTSDVYYPHLS